MLLSAAHLPGLLEGRPWGGRRGAGDRGPKARVPLLTCGAGAQASSRSHCVGSSVPLVKFRKLCYVPVTLCVCVCLCLHSLKILGGWVEAPRKNPESQDPAWPWPLTWVPLGYSSGPVLHSHPHTVCVHVCGASCVPLPVSCIPEHAVSCFLGGSCS